jgi:hypothetical protein
MANSTYFDDQIEKKAKAIRRAVLFDCESLYKMSHKKAVKELDDLVSLTVRIRDRFVCFTCGRHPSEVVAQAGHLISRTKYPTRWHEPNLYCQCSWCNKVHEYTPDIYRRKWESVRGGRDQYEKLVDLAFDRQKISRMMMVGLYQAWQYRLSDELAKNEIVLTKGNK